MGKGKLLIVDDEPLLLKRLKSNLEEYAGTVFTVQDGLEAIKIFKTEAIHCIVCDIKMPKMCGVEVLRHIRESGSKVPFIFFTGHGNSELMMEALKYGAYDFISKPEFEGLEEMVSRALKIGTGESDGKFDYMSDYMSEYQKLLQKIREEE